MPLGKNLELRKSNEALLSCAKCRKTTSIGTVTCGICKASYHRSCAILFIKFKTDVVCCVRSLGHLLESVPSPSANTPCAAPHRAPILPTPVPALAVHHSVFAPRDDTPFAAPFRAPTIPTPVPAVPVVYNVPPPRTDTPLTAPSRSPTNVIPVPAQHLPTATMSNPPAPLLPPGWASLGVQEQLTHVMETCVANGVMLTNLTASVQQNTAAIAHNASEIRALKEQKAHGETSTDILISGIPSFITLPHADIVSRLLVRLNLAHLNVDVLDIRTLNQRPTNAPTTSQAANPQHRYTTISLLVTFKSVAVRNRVIKAKRIVGNITVAEIFSDVVPATYEGLLYVKEFLPTPIHILHQKARIRTREVNYERVWIKDGVVFVRKTGNSPIIPIITEMDLQCLN